MRTLVRLVSLQAAEPNHYAALGLDRQCTDAQIRAAYRILAKQFHPDVNPGSAKAITQTQAINAAYETLSDPVLREAYDRSREAAGKRPASTRMGGSDKNVSQDLQLGIVDFLRGASLQVRVNDPGNPNGAEIYELDVPPETAPGTRFRVERTDSPEGGFVLVRVRARPDFRFKVRGSDLRCDLRITTNRAAQGGVEMVVGATGARMNVQIPPRVARGEVLRMVGEGLPKPRGGRGDLLVRIMYRPEVRITRRAGR